MGKKSRRQREVGGGVLQMKPERRFVTDHWRHKDGSPIKTEEIKKLYRAVQVTGQLQGFEQAQEEFKHEYISLVIHRRLVKKGSDSAIEAWARWRQMQTHWPRIRRRICDQCGRRVALSEPRFMVCGGCGVARYCSEACQIANWGHHQTVCAAVGRQAARERKVSATAKKMAQFQRGVLNASNGRFAHVDDF